MNRRWSLPVVALLSACGSGGEAAGPMPVRAGVTLAHDFGANPGFEELVVRDLVRRGDQLVMLIVRDRLSGLDDVGGDQHHYTPIYLVSDDAGASWREQPIAFVDGEAWSRGDLMFPSALVWQDDVLYELVLDWEDLATAQRQSLLVYRLELEGGYRRRVGALPGVHRLMRVDGELGSYRVDVRSGTTRRATWTTYDLATSQPSPVPLSADFDGAGIACLSGDWRVDSGVALTCANDMFGACDLHAPVPHRVAPTAACVAPEAWALEVGSNSVDRPLGRFVVLGDEHDRRVEQVEITGQWSGLETLAHTATVTRVPVGPGDLHERYQDDGYGRALDRFGGLVALYTRGPDASSVTTLYRRLGRTYAPTGLPTRPCSDGVPCGYLADTAQGGRVTSPLEWVLPWSPNEYLLVYLVNASKPSTFSSRHLVYVSRERLPPAPTEPTRDELATACGLATACFAPAAQFSLEGCFDRWLREPDTERVSAFLAARDCDAVDALLPDVALRATPCEAPGARCVGAVPVNCLEDGERHVGEPCITNGQRCDLVPSNGEDTTATWAACVGAYPHDCDTFSCEGDVLRACGVDIDCAAVGQACVDAQVVPGYELQAMCARPEPACTTTMASVCGAATAMTCAAPGHAFARELHCERIGLGCFMGECEAETADCEALEARCEGEVLSLCYRGRRVAVDCDAWGATCDDQGLRCHGRPPDGG